MATLRLRVVLTAILAATCIADGVTRALPVSTYSFRAWEGMSVNHAPTAPFEPWGRFDSRHSFGDLANMGNLPWMRVERHETFTIDRYGFRNPPDRAASGNVAALLLGDSFSAGSGVADDLSLGGQLTAAWRLPTYTLAPILISASSVQSFMTTLRMKPGSWIIHQQTYPYGEKQAWVVEPHAYPPVTAPRRFAQTVRADVSPLRIFVNQAWKRLQNGDWLTNPFAPAVHRGRLRSGDDLLFIAGETAPPAVSPDTAREIGESVRYATTMRDEARRLGLHYLVVLVPVKTAVYQHLMAPAGTPAVPPGTITETERQLREAGVPVLNLYRPLADRAERLLARHQLVYWRDDTHWNADGIATAAEAIAAAIARSGNDAR